MAPPPQVRENEDGWYHVLEGEPEVLAGEQTLATRRLFPAPRCTREMSGELACGSAQRAQPLNGSRVGR